MQPDSKLRHSPGAREQLDVFAEMKSVAYFCEWILLLLLPVYVLFLVPEIAHVL